MGGMIDNPTGPDEPDEPDECFDGYTILHVIFGIGLALATQSCCATTVRYLVAFAVMVLWEVFEYVGRSRGWTAGPSFWYDYESTCNRICDVVLGMVAFLLTDLAYSHL